MLHRLVRRADCNAARLPCPDRKRPASGGGRGGDEADSEHCVEHAINPERQLERVRVSTPHTLALGGAPHMQMDLGENIGRQTSFGVNQELLG